MLPNEGLNPIVKQDVDAIYKYFFRKVGKDWGLENNTKLNSILF